MQSRSQSRILPQIRGKDRLKNQVGESVSRDPSWASESGQNHKWNIYVSGSGVYPGFKSNTVNRKEVGLCVVLFIQPMALSLYQGVG